MKKEFPILEYDPTKVAVIEPSRIISPIKIPEHCVITFFQEIIEKLKKEGKAKQIANEISEIGTFPIYEVHSGKKEFALFHPGIGAPMAAGLLEFAIALGCRKFIACGGAGVFDQKMQGKIVLPTAAIRDEGTSYHYLPPSREVFPDPEALSSIKEILINHNYNFIFTKTWTTDAIYRETSPKIQLRKNEGCSVVEMEAATFFAVAKFRGVQFAQILYGGDIVGGDKWIQYESKSRATMREKIFWLAVEACLNL